MALRELRVGNVAVFSDARLEIPDGFVVLTGETGAGKSVCINALRAALGGRMEPEWVRAAAGGARVAAVFDDVEAGIRDRVLALGVADDELLTLSRELVRGGRSTCRINGALVSQAVLRDIGESLVEVTAQGASQRLLRRQWQRDILDAAGGEQLRAAAERAAAAHREWRDAEAAFIAAGQAAASDAAQVAEAREMVATLQPLRLEEGEDAALRAEVMMLRHAARIAEAALNLAEAAGAERGAADLIAAALGPATGLGAVDPHLTALAEEAAELVTRLRELALDARRHADTVNLDANRLATVEERLDAIGRVERRFGSLESALSALERAVQVVAAADDGGHELARCGEQVAASRTQLAATAAELTRCRRAAARRLEREVTAELRRLEMPATRFRVVLTRVTDPEGIDLGDGVAMRCTAQGTDVVELRLSAARDTLPMPLDQGPSGGELSRLALALAAVVAERGAPALVLDEIDSGIGGETAARVGDVLATIGRCRQVLAVTHRAEIAARARGHLVVARSAASGPTSSTVTVAEGDERIAEIARLLSGRRTRAALARATELIAEGAAEAEAAPAGSALPTI